MVLCSQRPVGVDLDVLVAAANVVGQERRSRSSLTRCCRARSRTASTSASAEPAWCSTGARAFPNR